ncbi:MAG: KH domain-containing protein [Firmicutes bacterium]|nr:KH domain-containing protein [Candidatus Colimorpha enterica]
MKQLLLDLARAIVDYPDQVTADEARDGDEIVFTLHVAESDMGKVIGRQGKNAKCIRIVMKAAAMKDDLKVTVDIAE